MIIVVSDGSGRTDRHSFVPDSTPSNAASFTRC